MFRRQQLLLEGVPRSEVDERCQNAVPIARGVYAPDDTSEDSLYAWRCQAALSGLTTTAALAGPSAAFLWDLPLLQRPTEVFLRGRSRGRCAPGVRVLHGQAEYTEHRGIPVTTPAWTVADCARLMSRRDALILADAALHEQLCTVADLESAVTGSRHARGAARARWVRDHADALSESPGETWMRMLAHELGYETTSQFEVRDGDFVAFIDLMLTDGRTGLEFDGLVKYRKPTEDHAANTVVREKLRQGRLEELGFQLLRVVWVQLSDPVAFDRRIRAQGVRPTKHPRARSPERIR